MTDDVTKVERAEPVPGCPQPIGYALWHLEEAREWTLSYIDGISQRALDVVPQGHRYSVATLLYHIAVFEVDWVYTDVLGNDYDMERRIPGCPPEVAAVLPYPLLLEDGSYTTVAGEPLPTHLERLTVIRRHLIEVFKKMDLDDFRAPRPSGDIAVTPEWVLMHLARHESEHRGQIWVARVAVEASPLDPSQDREIHD
ncbi:MAG: DinB family protein [Acidimicrobiia bacterium]